MKMKEYLIDKRYLVLFYIILMSFISAVIYLDPTVKVNVNNILYINFVSLVFFLLYLTGIYLFQKRYYNIITDIINNQEEGIIHSLPEPKTYEQNLYNQLLREISNEKDIQIQQLHEEKRENLEFTTTWVHEIKTPIAVSRLIMENSLEKNLDEVLDNLEDELDKIDNYVEQSLYYSRLDSFSKDYFITEIDLGKVVKEIVKKHAKTFINKKIRIEIEDSNLNVSTDKKWLTFIINQILSNSLKYTSECGRIKICFEKDEKEKKLIIEDNGIGIKSEDIRRVFDKGFTGHTGRQDYKSTGMGLYLAKKLARKLGHDITINSVYGEYTKVTIHFPKLIDYFNVTKR
ncbi:sensor histidine kinase [Clostridium ganghwense]|uniref:histidine kinase n=1 Tax=Clostridium ganghwense TaxID=312089 RepID=A0ABT4CPW8_9CLOT|nr:sensor histidine kinase [Clostridium ganghwense]MCY6371107.1 sensor histidine kinase [Clostridium ganghwense]